MAITDFAVIAPDKRQHHDAIVDLISKVFSQEGYFTFRGFCTGVYIDHSHYDWNASRIGVIDQQVVTHYGVWNYEMRIGAAHVQTGGIGVVATHGDYRKRGLMAQTVHASLAAMRARGYDMTVLFGIDNFYHKFGYVRGWPETVYQVNVADLPAAVPTVRARKSTPRSRSDLDARYNREYAATTGTAVRPTYQRYGFFCHTALQGYQWSDADGRLDGYVLFFHKGSYLSCIEAAGEVEQILRILAQQARRQGCQQVEFRTIPEQSALCKRLRQGNCRQISDYRRCGAAMISLLNLPAAMQKLAGELSRRLQASPLADWRGDLLIANEQDTVTLAIAHGQIAVTTPRETPHAIRGGHDIARLLLGTDAPESIANEAGITLLGDAFHLLGALFPQQYPTLSFYDRY